MTIDLHLPEDTQSYLNEKVQQEGHANPGEYLAALLEEQRRREAKQRLDALLLEGLNSGPATPWTPEDRQDIRRERYSYFQY